MAARESIGVAILSLVFLAVVGGGVYVYFSTRPPDPLTQADEHYGEARRWMNQAQWPMALQSCNEALRLNPDLYDANRVRGEALLNLRDPEGAIRDLTIAIAHGHDNVATRLLRAKAYRDAERLDDAAEEFALVVRLAPDNREVLGESGQLLLDRGHYEEALDVLGQQVKRVPADARSWRNIGWANWGLGRYDDAVPAFTRALQELPDNYHAQYGRGVTHSHRRDFEEAIADLEAVCSSPEHTADYAHFFLFLTRMRIGETELARAALTTHRSDHVDRHHRNDWVGVITQFLLGDLTEEEFIERIEETGDTPDPEIAVEGWYYAGMMRLVRGDREGAAPLFQWCIETEMYRYYEYHAAMAELRALGLAEPAAESGTDQSD